MRSISFRLAALRAGALPGPFLFLICYANALHFILRDRGLARRLARSNTLYLLSVSL